ncbi:MAG: hypothetical protein Q8L56_07100 [Rhodocyclaceae bacterium]|nr:hypothetical protein [Rhodocyclaceae bacterium]
MMDMQGRQAESVWHSAPLRREHMEQNDGIHSAGKARHDMLACPHITLQAGSSCYVEQLGRAVSAQ